VLLRSFEGIWLCVSSNVASVRPTKMTCFAPAAAKAKAISRPIPLPFVGLVSHATMCALRWCAYRASNDDRLPNLAILWASGINARVRITVPSRRR
jgi:hypothetical protein